MKSLQKTPFIASLLVVLCYVTLTTQAIVRYPLPFSPLNNWLSDLGNLEASPAGGPFYNAGIITSGIILLVFFLTLSGLKLAQNKIQKIMVGLTQGFGVAGAAAMIMSAIYPINIPGPHSFWSAALDIGLGTAFAFSVAALRYYPSVPKWILALGVLTALTDMAFAVFSSSLFILEWITISLFLVYLITLGATSKRLLTAGIRDFSLDADYHN